MGRKMCSIGSVIKSNNALCLVVGIKYVEQANKYIKKYLVVTYPLGYIDSNSIRVLEESEFDVVELGYDSSDKSVFNQYYVGMMDTLIEKTDSKTIKETIEKANTMIREGIK